MIADEFTLELGLGAWAFTLALGLPAGLALAGMWMAFRDWRGGWRWPGVGLAIMGGAAFLMVAALPVDRLPLNLLPIKLKLYLSEAATAAALDLAFALGLGVSVGAVLLSRRLARSRNLQPGITACVQLGVVGVLLTGAVAWANAETTPGRHPTDTNTGATVGAARIIPDVSMVTGLDIGPAGEIAFVELEGGVLRISGADRERTIPLEIPDGSQSFHVALHPEWPAQPYAYVTIARPLDGGREMQLLRVRTDGQSDVRPVVVDLPISTPVQGNHYGSALAFCGRALFLSTGDTDHVFEGPQSAISARAQLPFDPGGKVLRYRLDGIDVAPDGVNGDNPPVFAMGFRNPFAMACDEQLLLPVVADNGRDKHDQVRLVEAGSNHEWPTSDARDGLSKPLFDTGDRTVAPTGVGVRRRAGRREIVLAAFKSGGLYVLQLGADGRVSKRPRLLHEFEYGLISLALDENGCIYVADPFAIWRIEEEECR